MSIRQNKRKKKEALALKEKRELESSKISFYNKAKAEGTWPAHLKLADLFPELKPKTEKELLGWLKPKEEPKESA